MLNSRSRVRRFRKTNGARSLSHSMSDGSPRLSLDATSAISREYAASTDCSGVSSPGRSFSGRMVLMKYLVRGQGWDIWVPWDAWVPFRAPAPACLDFHLDRQRPRLRVLGHF